MSENCPVRSWLHVKILTPHHLCENPYSQAMSGGEESSSANRQAWTPCPTPAGVIQEPQAQNKEKGGDLGPPLALTYQGLFECLTLQNPEDAGCEEEISKEMVQRNSHSWVSFASVKTGKLGVVFSSDRCVGILHEVLVVFPKYGEEAKRRVFCEPNV